MRKMTWVLAALALAAPAAIASGVTNQAIGYICSAEGHQPGLGPKLLKITTGMGTGGFPIQTANPQAQAWFDYGVKLAHAFYHEDAKTAFRKAEELDPACAMCVWGEAWSRGPTLNFDVSTAETAADLALADKAADLAAKSSQRERDLIAALQQRYAPGGTVAANMAFAKAMDGLVKRYPDDNEIAIMSADAWLIINQRNGDHSGPPRAIEELQTVLARRPNDTGAIHFYIHATELAGTPGLAEPYANRLGALAPEASHLVHMPAHTFLDVGRYEDAAVVNAQSLKVDADYAQATHAPGLTSVASFYYTHDLSFGLEGAIMAGDRALALKFADDTAIAYPDKANLASGPMLIGRGYVAYARFDPDRVLSLPEPAKAQTYRDLMWRYARGEALASKGDVKGVAAESAQIVAGFGPKPDLSGANAQVELGRRVLDGRAAMLAGKPEIAAQIFQDAAVFQDQQKWRRDPPPFWYPVRRSVAAADYQAGKYDLAVIEAETTLKTWPNDPLTLWVLGQSEQKLGHKEAAFAHLAEAKGAWHGDVKQISMNLI